MNTIYFTKKLTKIPMIWDRDSHTFPTLEAETQSLNPQLIRTRTILLKTVWVKEEKKSKRNKHAANTKYSQDIITCSSERGVNTSDEVQHNIRGADDQLEWQRGDLWAGQLLTTGCRSCLGSSQTPLLSQPGAWSPWVKVEGQPTCCWNGMVSLRRFPNPAHQSSWQPWSLTTSLSHVSGIASSFSLLKCSEFLITDITLLSI